MVMAGPQRTSEQQQKEANERGGFVILKVAIEIS